MIPLLLALVAGAGPVERGELIAGLAGCASCHTAPDGAAYAGGHVLDTRWGQFTGSNLTPDVDHGLGAWSFDDFERAIRKGRSPRGRPYYPAFPYTSFHAITDADLVDLWAFLQSVEPSSRPNEDHDLDGLNGWRFLLRFWKITGFRKLPETLERGAYLGTAVGHCGECHSPRGSLGVAKRHRALAGSDEAPNITPSSDGIGGWSVGELTNFLEDGMGPDGDVTGGEMRRLVRTGTARLTAEDRRALAAWVLAHPPLDDRGRPAAAPVHSDGHRSADDW